MPDLTVYMFTVPEGKEMSYPDAELWTLNYEEADAFAAKKGYQLVCHDLIMEEGGMIADYTACVICGVLIEKTGGGWGHIEDYGDEFEVHNAALSAVLVTRETP